MHAIGEAEKTGWLYLLDRTNGKPLFPMPERPVPQNAQQKTYATQPIPSYAPSVAMSHFTKLECFCFSEHVLKPGESKQWPVVFVPWTPETSLITI